MGVSPVSKIIFENLEFFKNNYRNPDFFFEFRSFFEKLLQKNLDTPRLFSNFEIFIMENRSELMEKRRAAL